MSKQDTKVPVTSDFSGRQQSLFQVFLCNTDKEREDLSNTIELWDLVPKYSVSKKTQNDIRKNGMLPIHEHNFVHMKKHFTLKIHPARVVVDGKEKEFYPGAREEIVEDALRKIATEDDQLFFDGNRSGVRFTLHNLRKELKRRGHTLSYTEVVEALTILKRSNIEISDFKGRVICESNIIRDLITVNQKEIREDPSARWYADFSILVTEGIKQLQYRQYNYTRIMSYKSQLSRWINKRLIHNYKQASLTKQYHIKLSTVARDSGLLIAKREKDNRVKFERSLKELKKGNVIMHYEGEEKRGERNKLLDVVYTIMPHHDFIEEQKAANKREQKSLEN